MMSIGLNILAILLLYLLGVVVSIVLIAYINSVGDDGDVFEKGFAIMSWAFLFFVIIMTIAYFVVTFFTDFYDKVYRFFEKRKDEN